MRLAPLLLCALLAPPLAGCFADAPAAPPIPPLRAGDRAEYGDPNGAWTLHVVVEGLATVLDADGAQVRAALLHRWLNATADNVSLHEIEAVDPDGGRTYWIARPCSFLQGGECTSQLAVHLNVRGLPGALGRAWMEMSAASDRDAEGCAGVAGASHPVHGRVLAPFMPATLAEGNDALFCPAAPLPLLLWMPRAENLTLTAFHPGEGAAISFTSPGAPLRTPVAPPRTPWNGVRPTPEWPGPFDLEEAWRWLKENSTEFRAFFDKHPEARLHSTSLGERVRFRGPDENGTTVEEHRTPRVLTVQASTGEALHVTVTKTVEEGVLKAIEQGSARGGRGHASLVTEELPERMVSPLDATRSVLARVEGSWEDTHVLSALETAPGAFVQTRSHYVYRVLLRPPGVPDGVASYFSNFAVIRSHTGELDYVVAQAGFILPGRR